MTSGSPLNSLPTPQRSPSPALATASTTPRVVPLTCHGHSRPVTHLSFSHIVDDDQYYLISACKDGNPMLRDGITGDWIGTFIGHKGAVWQARLSADASLAVTGSADFSAKVWDTHTGEVLQTLQHNHIVRTVTFAPNTTTVATGGPEKKLRVFDLKRSGSEMEIGAGLHGATIKCVAWAEPNVLVSAADDKVVRWWDVRSNQLIEKFETGSLIGSCEFSADGQILNIAAGKTVFFFNGSSRQLLKSIVTEHDCASVALHAPTRRFVTGGAGDTWARLHDYETGKEQEIYKGHHGPIWSVSFSPDGNLYATGSEDGTIKLWKYSATPYGLWR